MQFLTSQVTRRGQHGKLAEVTVFAEKNHSVRQLDQIRQRLEIGIIGNKEEL